MVQEYLIRNPEKSNPIFKNALNNWNLDDPNSLLLLQGYIDILNPPSKEFYETLHENKIFWKYMQEFQQFKKEKRIQQRHVQKVYEMDTKLMHIRINNQEKT